MAEEAGSSAPPAAADARMNAAATADPGADDEPNKRQRLLAGMATLHEPSMVSSPLGAVSVHGCTTPAAEEFEPQVMDTNRDYYGAKSGQQLGLETAQQARELEIENTSPSR